MMVKWFFDVIGALLRIPFIGFFFWLFVLYGVLALVCGIIGIFTGDNPFESSEPVREERPKKRKDDNSIPPEEQEPFTLAETALLFYSLFKNDSDKDD